MNIVIYSDDQRFMGFHNRTSEVINDTYVHFNLKARLESDLANIDDELHRRILLERAWISLWKVFYDKKEFTLGVSVTISFADFFLQKVDNAVALKKEVIENANFTFPYFDFEILNSSLDEKSEVATKTIAAFNEKLLKDDDPLGSYRNKGRSWQMDILQTSWTKFTQNPFRKKKEYERIEIDGSENSVYYYFRRIVKNVRIDDYKKNNRRIDTDSLDEVSPTQESTSANPEDDLVNKDISSFYLSQIELLGAKCSFLIKRRTLEGMGWKEIYKLWNLEFLDEPVEFTPKTRILQQKLRMCFRKLKDYFKKD